MSKKLILVYVFVIFFSSFHFVFASLSINEIMYDVSGSDSVSGKSREWIEVYNSGPNDVSVDASKWRISVSDTTKWTMNNGDDFSIPANSYVIFAGDKSTFLADNPNFSWTVYETGISSLNNTGGTIKILDQDGNSVDSVTYTSGEGGAGDGNSLQLINGSWVGSIPTPGLQNATTVSSNTPVASGGLPANYSNNTSISSTSTTQTQNQSQILKIKTEIVGKTFGFVGLPISLSANATGHSGEKLFFGNYYWNFGDGDSKIVGLADAKTFSHTYYYPGDYIVTLDYYQSYFSADALPDASTQLHIKIIPADIAITNTGDEKNFFVELTNNTDYSADISGWVLSSAQKSFMFSLDTVIPSKQKLILPPQVSGFSFADKSTLKLENLEGNTVFDYSSPVVLSAENKVAAVDKPTDVGRLETSRLPTSVTAADIIPPAPSDFTASAVSGEGAKTDSAPKSKTTLIFFLSIIFIGISAYAVYYIRQKNIIQKENGSDFEILDE